MGGATSARRRAPAANDERGRLCFDFLASTRVVVDIAVEDCVSQLVNEHRELLVGQGVGEDDNGLPRVRLPNLRRLKQEASS